MGRGVRACRNKSHVVLSASDECLKMQLCGAVPQEGQNVNRAPPPAPSGTRI